MPPLTPSNEVAGALVVTDDGSSTLYSPRYRQSYHSQRGALSEARQVFLEGSCVGAVLDAGGEMRVLEIGFGSGLNFLVSADRACERGGDLHYVALDRTLPSAEQLAALDHGRHLLHPELFERLLELRRGIGPDTAERSCRIARVQLELRFGDANETRLESERYHAVYHDGFSPDTNPELWSDAFLGKLFTALVPGGRLATYTVKGEVRRRLSALGFEVHKRRGPLGGKREVLLARKPGGSDDLTARG